jgi:hypothetical protein
MRARLRRQRMDEEDDRKQPQRTPAASARARYAIRVHGHLHLDWSEWLEGMTLTHEESGATRLEGPIRDQAALRGLLNRLWDLHLTILTVQRQDAAGGTVAIPEAPTETAP